VDAEGSEVEVLRGAARTLRCTKRVILEYHSGELRDRVSSLLEAGGFRQVLHLDTPAPYLPEAGMIYAERGAAAGAGAADAAGSAAAPGGVSRRMTRAGTPPTIA